MSARKRINKQKFYAINRDVKIPGRTVKSIAAFHNVSEETVRTIKRAKTWPRFEAAKKLKNERRRPTPAEQGVFTIPQPVLVAPTEEELDKITKAPENQIRPPVTGDYSANPHFEVKVLTVLEWDALNRKINRLYDHVTKKQRKPLLSIFRRTK